MKDIPTDIPHNLDLLDSCSLYTCLLPHAPKFLLWMIRFLMYEGVDGTLSGVYGYCHVITSENGRSQSVLRILSNLVVCRTAQARDQLLPPKLSMSVVMPKFFILHTLKTSYIYLDDCLLLLDHGSIAIESKSLLLHFCRS